MGKQKGKYPYVSEKEYEELRPYLVTKSQSRAAKGKMELDPSMTAYTPGETLDLLKHPNWNNSAEVTVEFMPQGSDSKSAYDWLKEL